MAMHTLEKLTDSERADLLESFYEADWAVPGRSFAVEDLRSAAAPGFEWRIESRNPPLAVGEGGIGIVGEGLEQDFSSYRRNAMEQRRDAGAIIVRGLIRARARSSREWVERRFVDRWVFDSGRLDLLVCR